MALDLTRTRSYAKDEGRDPTHLAKTKSTFADLTKMVLFKNAYDGNLTEETSLVTGMIVKDAFVKADRIVDFDDAIEGVSDAIVATVAKFRLEDPNIDVS